MDIIRSILNKMLDISAKDIIPFYENNKDYFDNQNEKSIWLFAKLYDYCLKTNNNELILLAKELKNELHVYSLQNSEDIPLFWIDKSNIVDESFIGNFIKDIESCKIGNIKFEEIKSPYKTKKEFLMYEGISDMALKNVIMKYSSYNHPYIWDYFQDIKFHSERYNEWLAFLYKGIRDIFTFPNKYWDSKYGIIGSTWLSIYFFKAIKPIENVELINKLLKIVFLYITRALCIVDDITTIDLLRNRAWISQEAFKRYRGALPLGVNPDYIFISDMYLAWHRSTELKLGWMFKQCYDESLMMYRYGRLKPSNENWYVDIDERTYLQIVNNTYDRNLLIASSYQMEFEKGKLNISNKEINDSLKLVKKEIESNYKQFIDRVSPKKS